MSCNIDLYEDTGAVLSGRGTNVVLLDSWDLKKSADSAYVYYPTNETTCAPMVRPFNIAGQQDYSFKKYLSFKVDGTYTKIKNLKVTISTSGDFDTDKAQLFYKLSNVYQVPDDNFDGDMMLLANNELILTNTLYPMISNTSPQTATTRNVTFGPNQTLYTEFIILQMRINNNCVIGNTPEFNIKFEANDYT